MSWPVFPAQCSACGCVFGVPAIMAGAAARCPNCGREIHPPGYKPPITAGRVMLIIVLVLLIVGAVGAIRKQMSDYSGEGRPAPPPASAWKVFRAPGGAFEVEMPGTPADKSRKLANGVPLPIFELVHAGGVEYVASYNDVAGDLSDSELLAGFVHGAGTANGAKLRAEDTRSFRHQGFAAREFLTDMPDGRTVAGLAVVAGKRMHHLVHVGKAADVNLKAAHVRRFFQSLKIPTAAPADASQPAPAASKSVESAPTAPLK